MWLKCLQFSWHQQKNNHPKQEQETVSHLVNILCINMYDMLVYEWLLIFIWMYFRPVHMEVCNITCRIKPNECFCISDKCADTQSVTHSERVLQQERQLFHPAPNQRVSSGLGHRAPCCLLPTQTEECACCSLQNTWAWVELQDSTYLRYQGRQCLRKRMPTTESKLKKLIKWMWIRSI